MPTVRRKRLNPCSNGMKIEFYDDGDIKVEFPS